MVKPTAILRERFERELEVLRDIFGRHSRQVEIAEEDGPMSWDEAMSEPIIFPLKLDVGGEIRIKINHRESNGPLLGGEKVMK